MIKKSVLSFLGVVMLFSVFVYINRRKSKGHKDVNVVVVQKRVIREWVEGDGEAKPIKLIKVGSDVTARIEKILKREGDSVRRGDTICILMHLFIVQKSRSFWHGWRWIYILLRVVKGIMKGP